MDLEPERHLQAGAGALRGLITALGLEFDERPEVQDAVVDSLLPYRAATAAYNGNLSPSPKTCKAP